MVLHEAPVPQLGNLAASSVTDFCLMHIPSDLTDLSYELVMHERVLLVAHRDHPWSGGWTAPGTAPSPLRGPAAAGEGAADDAPGGLAAVQAAVQHVQRPERGAGEHLTTTNNTTAINLVAENMGFTFLSESGIRRTSYMDRLSFFTVGEPPLTSPLALVYKKNGFLSPPPACS